MNTTAFLVTGQEFRFRKKIARFRQLLEKSDCTVEIVSAHSPFFLKELRAAIAKTSDDSVFLYAFHGHGNPFGYEGGAGYTDLAIILSKVKGKLLIINDTCYGLVFLEYIQTRRKDPEKNCFISPWDSARECYGGPVADALQFWQDSKIVEDCISGNIHSSDQGDVEVPIQQHWGSRFEHYFFPKNKQLPS